MKILMFFTVIACVAGCATSPVNFQDARMGEMVNFAHPDATHTANIIVLRDTGMVASGVDVSFTVDGVLAASLGSGTKAVFWVTPGVHVITANPNSNWSRTSVSVTVTPNVSATLRYSPQTCNFLASALWMCPHPLLTLVSGGNAKL